MKPIKLVISAIGPYADTMPAIDFTRYEDNGIFLICGDTGAGKTTIFDAICYALFGTASGSYRDSRYLWSEYAREDVKSFVEFTFSHQGRRYTAYRQPQYLRKKLRGDGMKLEEECAILTEEGQPPIEGLQAVKAAMSSLLGISEPQFKQIAMIAQGEFWKLLNASTKDRTEILRSIFQTGGYEQIGAILKQRVSENEGRIRSMEQRIAQFFMDVRTASESDAANEIAAIRQRLEHNTGAWTFDELTSVLHRVLAFDREEAAGLTQKLQAEQTQQQHLSDALATAVLNNDLIQHLEVLKQKEASLAHQREEMEQRSALLIRQKQAFYTVAPGYREWCAREADANASTQQIQSETEALELASAAARIASEEAEKAEQGRTVMDEQRQLADRIRREEERYQSREQAFRTLQTLTAEHETLMQNAEHLQKEASALELRRNALLTVIDEYREQPAQKVRLAGEGTVLIALSDRMQRIRTDSLKKWERGQADQRDTQADFVKARAAFDAAETARKQAETVLENCRAGILAQSLADGQPCPVCGALHHPSPAVLPEQVMTEQRCHELKEAEALARTKKEQALAAVERAKTACTERETTLRQEILRCLRDDALSADDFTVNDDAELRLLIDALDRAALVISQKIIENKAAQEAIQAACLKKEAAETALSEETKRQDALSLKKEAILQQLQENEKQQSACDSVMKTLHHLPYHNWADAKSAMQKATVQADQIREQIQRAVTKKEAAETQVQRLGASLATLRDTLTRQTHLAAEKKEAFDRTLAEAGFASIEEMQQILVSEAEILESEALVQNYRQETAANRAQLETARQNAEGKERLDLNELQLQLTEQSERVEAIRTKLAQVNERQALNEQRQADILQQKEQLEAIRKQHTICSRLSALVSGKTRNGKITLEQYLQAAGFDSILRAANRRLLPMSNGQYQLCRMEDPTDRRSQTFLDLEVLDYYTGHRRPVKNLSGGESFKASLSLALGLSDTVSSHLGGIQIDALFVDEGFGSLDRNSIDNAMDILLNLSEANKLVGIISHREELMETIPQQIRVKKATDGSHLSFEG